MTAKTESPTAAMSAIEQVHEDERLQLENFRRMVRDVSTAQLLKWTGMPPEYEPPKAMFYRCGLKGANAAEALAAHMCQAGWKKVPAKWPVRCGIFQTDGENGLYVYITAPGWAMYQDIVNEESRRIEAINTGRGAAHHAALQNMRGLNIERMEVSVKTGSHGDFAEDARRRR